MTVCKPWNFTSNLFYHNLPISFTLHVSYLYLSLFLKKKKLQMQLDIVDGEDDGIIDKIQQILKTDLGMHGILCISILKSLIQLRMQKQTSQTLRI